MKQTLTALFASLVLAQGCSSPHAFLRELYPQSKEAQRLTVNSDEKQFFRVRHSEKEGISEISHLVATEEFEEAWIYIPKEDEWWEIGQASWKDSVGVYTALNYSLLELLAGVSDEVIHYHIHPEKTLRKLSTPPLLPGTPPPALTLTEWALPSDIDLYSSLVQSCDVASHFPGKKIRFKVASPAGIVEYAPVKSTFEEICSRDFPKRHRAFRDAVNQTVLGLSFNFTDVSRKLVDGREVDTPTVIYQGDYFSYTFTRY
ncbi:hypothetical protein HYT55_00150 [Candidatus Woesearchaeota archaeon]|nr:hypothetical protein [Candidatus Woesearchaeota archaeon]